MAHVQHMRAFVSHQVSALELMVPVTLPWHIRSGVDDEAPASGQFRSRPLSQHGFSLTCLCHQRYGTSSYWA